MSWEEMYTCSATCPCGKGKITQTSYGDDWNRYKDGPVVIECEECAKKYKIEEVTHHGLLASDGSWSTYYLTPKDYPDYDGPKESDLYPATLNQYQDFSVWLIENFTEDELLGVLAQLKNTTSSAKLTGIAVGIREAQKKLKRQFVWARSQRRLKQLWRSILTMLETSSSVKKLERKNPMHVMLT